MKDIGRKRVAQIWDRVRYHWNRARLADRMNRDREARINRDLMARHFRVWKLFRAAERKQEREAL